MVELASDEWLNVQGEDVLCWGQSLASSAASGIEDATSALAAGATEKTMLAFSTNLGWLIGPFHTKF